MKNLEHKKNMSCTDVIKCVFNFNKLDIEVYKQLNDTREIRASLLASNMNRERSTVYRSLQRLTECGLCSKERKNIKSGGYYYVYQGKDVNTVKNQLDKCVDDWYFSMKNKLSTFEKDMS